MPLCRYEGIMPKETEIGRAGTMGRGGDTRAPKEGKGNGWITSGRYFSF